MRSIVDTSAASVVDTTAAAAGDAVERSPCPLCDADAPIDTPYQCDPVGVVRCGRCAAWYLSPRLTEARMRAHYQGDAYFLGDAVGYVDYATQEQSLRATFRRLLRRLAARGAVGGSLLEVGCGYGFLLREAAPYFRERVGCEMACGAARQARAHADEVYTGSIESVPKDRRFDCIVAVHVLEHVYRPRDFMAQLCGRLRPRGTVVLAVPDMGGLWRRVLGRRWPSFKFPEHVVFYDRASLGALMREAGLRDLRALPYPHAFPVNEVCRKLGMTAPAGIARLNVWIPGTTVAISGRAPATGTA